MDRFLCSRRTSMDDSLQPEEEQICIEQVQAQPQDNFASSIFEAILEKDIGKVNELLDNHDNDCLSIKDIRDVKKGKKSVMHYLADMTIEPQKEQDIQDMFNLFIQKECLVDATDEFGNTPIKLAAEKGNILILNLLIKNKADVNKYDKHLGDTPLHWAAKQGKLSAVHILIEQGKASVNQSNNAHKTPLHLAVEGKNKHVTLLLLYHMADRDSRDKEGKNPLAYAQTNHFSDIEKLLNEPQEKFKNTQLLLKYAEENNYPEIVRLFKQPEGHGEFVTADSPSQVVNYHFYVNMADSAQAAIGPNATFNANQSREDQQIIDTTSGSASAVSQVPSAPQEPEDNLSPYTT